MKNINEFLGKLKDLPKKTREEIVSEKNSTIQLEVIILGYDDDKVTFGHYDQVFSIQKSELISLGDLPHGLANTFGYGYPALLSVKSLTKVIQLKEYTAGDLISNQPFVISRPSLTFAAGVKASNIDHVKWMKDRGIYPQENLDANTETYTWQTSPQYTTTYTDTENGLDRKVDRFDVDSYPNDRQTLDD